MGTEPLLLTLLYAVSAVAVIGALNSRDTVRLVVSSLLAIFCLAAAVFHTSRFMALNEAVVLPPPPPPKVEPKAPPETVIVKPDTAGLAASKREAVLAQGKTELRGVLALAQRLQQNLSAFDLSRVTDVSDEEYQQMQGRAQAYSADARRLQDRVKEAIGKLPAGLEDAAEGLNNAVEALAGAAHNLERYFKSENDSEEKERLANFKRGAQAAESALRKAEIRLGPNAAATP